MDAFSRRIQQFVIINGNEKTNAPTIPIQIIPGIVQILNCAANSGTTNIEFNTHQKDAIAYAAPNNIEFMTALFRPGIK